MTSSATNDINDGQSELESAETEGRKISKFFVFNRWTHTATNGGGLTQGTPTTLTWSFPADGVITDTDLNPNVVNLSLDEIVSDIDFGTRGLPIGAGGSDAFVLTYSAHSVTVTISTNGGAASTIGTFPLNEPLVVDGGGGTDSVRFVGTSGFDQFTVIAANVIGGRVSDAVNVVTLISVEQRTLAGGASHDQYQSDTNTQLGTFTLEESGAGDDLLDFSTSDLAVNINAGLSITQVVNTNLSLILGATNVFDDVDGGSGSDRITGNSFTNFIIGNNGNDVLNGLGGIDDLDGAAGNDTYVFSVATSAESDMIREAVTGGTDTLDFSGITIGNVSIKLSIK